MPRLELEFSMFFYNSIFPCIIRICVYTKAYIIARKLVLWFESNYAFFRSEEGLECAEEWRDNFWLCVNKVSLCNDPMSLVQQKYGQKERHLRPNFTVATRTWIKRLFSSRERD